MYMYVIMVIHGREPQFLASAREREMSAGSRKIELIRTAIASGCDAVAIKVVCYIVLALMNYIKFVWVYSIPPRLLNPMISFWRVYSTAQHLSTENTTRMRVTRFDH